MNNRLKLILFLVVGFMQVSVNVPKLFQDSRFYSVPVVSLLVINIALTFFVAKREVETIGERKFRVGGWIALFLAGEMIFGLLVGSYLKDNLYVYMVLLVGGFLFIFYALHMGMRIIKDAASKSKIQQ